MSSELELLKQRVAELEATRQSSAPKIVTAAPVAKSGRVVREIKHYKNTTFKPMHVARAESQPKAVQASDYVDYKTGTIIGAKPVTPYGPRGRGQ